MKNIFGYARFAFYVLALPLLATAVVSAHQYFLQNTPLKAAASVVIERAVSGLTGTFRNDILNVDEQGNVRGLVSSVETDLSTRGLKSMRVCLARDGRIVHVCNTNNFGQFDFSGVEEGVYTFIVSGREGFATYGMKVVRGSGANKIQVAVVNPNFRKVEEIFESVKKPGQESRTAAAEVPAASDGNNLVAINGGHLVGQLTNLRTGEISFDTKAYLVRNNQQLAESSIDEFGQFSFADVEPGIYEFVAAGTTGFSAFSFEAVDGDSQVAVNSEVDSNEFFPVAETLTVGLSDSSDASIVNEQLQDASGAGSSGNSVVEPGSGQNVGDQVSSGSAAGSAGDFSGASGGGAGGGSAGAAGGSGLVGLGRLAILGWILTELINNDNPPPPVSPST